MNSARHEKQGSAGNRDLMSAVSGVKGYCVFDGSGQALVQRGQGMHQVDWGGASAIVSDGFEEAGELLGIGSLSVVTARSAGSCCLIANRDGSRLALVSEPGVSLGKLEELVATGNWIPSTPVQDDSDVECVSSRHLTPLGTCDMTIPAREAGCETSTPKTSLDSDGAGPTGESELRRAVAAGDLSAVARISPTIGRAAAVCVQGQPSTNVLGLDVLSSSIAAVLCGDSEGGLRGLESISEYPEVAPSIRWAAALWSARASIGMPEGLDAALVYAESAARAAKQLDLPSRAVSNRLLAEVGFFRRELHRVSRHVEIAKRLLEVASDFRGLSSLAVLEARAHLAHNDWAAAESAAVSARRAHPDSAEALTILCHCAMHRADVGHARRLIDDTPAGAIQGRVVRRLTRLLDSIEGGAIAPEIAVEFLSLDDCSPNRESIARLSALCQTAPSLDIFHESLGWKLLRTTRLHRAKEVFSRLEQHPEITDDARASVSLALGLLAAIQVIGASSEVRLHAAVSATDAIPMVARLSDRPRKLSPLDCTSIFPPASKFSLPPPSAALGAGQSNADAPLFAGELHCFGLTELVEFLCLGQRTGTLICGSVRGIVAIQFCVGRIAGAAAPNVPSFRDTLVAYGKASAERMVGLDVRNRRTAETTPFGTLAVQEGGIKVCDVVDLLELQVERVLTKLINWDDALFAFAAEKHNVDGEDHVATTLSGEVLVDLLAKHEGSRMGQVS